LLSLADFDADNADVLSDIVMMLVSNSTCGPEESVIVPVSSTSTVFLLISVTFLPFLHA
jgi:hypothetical protein